ncbi:MAG: DUF432 domain-containing protein [Thermodesulfobacteriota bacterium]|nr:DUF432 domain-containing protein [Thermodesulfobacteriota bacterium]
MYKVKEETREAATNGPESSPMDMDTSGAMFGSHSIPLFIHAGGIALSVNKQGDSLLYKRESEHETIERVLLADNAQLIINPVEPLNKPKEISPFLHIGFKKSLVVAPRISRVVFISFPIEVGVFISKGKDIESIDIFTLMKQKFTLYGDPRNGIICKSWESDVHFVIPSPTPLHEGVLSLKVTNTTDKWLEVSQAVFNAYGMKIYYNKGSVSMKASMRIMSSRIAETDFTDSPVMEEMDKSLELYTIRKLVVATTKYVMEAGI